MDIGNVELPIVSDIVDSSEAKVDEIKANPAKGDTIDSVPVKHEESVESITILGFINQELHSSQLSLDQQKKEIKSLREKGKLDNTINYKSYKGHLLVDKVDVLDDGASRIVDEVEIESRYFPWPKYYPGDEP